MGSYRIVIEGVGAHHNHRDGVVDADVEAAAVVEKLRSNGHSLVDARFELTEGTLGPVHSTVNLLTGETVQTDAGATASG